MTERKTHLIGRIYQIVRDFFEVNISVPEIQTKDLMPLFVKQGFLKWIHKTGYQFVIFLWELDTVNKHHLVRNLKVFRKDITRN